jgi:hypothetical protein
MSKQPRDDANSPIPVLGLKKHGGQQISIGGSATLSDPFSLKTRVISIYATEDCFVEIGDADIEANTSNSHIVPGTIMLDLSISSDLVSSTTSRYLSVIGALGGTLYISERE